MSSGRRMRFEIAARWGSSARERAVAKTWRFWRADEIESARALALQPMMRIESRGGGILRGMGCPGERWRGWWWWWWWWRMGGGRGECRLGTWFRW